jgi:hypothetical protein
MPAYPSSHSYTSSCAQCPRPGTVPEHPPALGENVREFFFRVAALTFEANVLAELEKSGARRIGDVVSECPPGLGWQRAKGTSNPFHVFSTLPQALTVMTATST